MAGIGWLGAGFVALLAGVLGSAPAALAAPPWAKDPIFVYYPRGDCRGDALELQVWDRDGLLWRRHPGHSRVPLETCQLEDAGKLFNEIRFRCIEPASSDDPPPWVVGLDVFDPDVTQTCAVQQAEPTGDLGLHVVSPAPGERVTPRSLEVTVRGAVRMNGIDGTDYDLLLVIDRSSGTQHGEFDLLEAQVRAARALIKRLIPRLGPVRVGIVSYPNMPPLPGSDGGTGARRVVPLTDDFAALERGLRDVLRRRASGFQTFGSALDFALSELEGQDPRARARRGARKLVAIAADASGTRPFGPAAAADARFLSQLEARLERADARRVGLHLFALGGLSEELAPQLAERFERADARFHRVLRPALDKPFLARVPLPRVTQVVVTNRTLGAAESSARVTPGGRFSTPLAAASGTNRLWARATLSDGTTAEREWTFDLDDRVVKQLLLAAEREHMRQVREKRLRLHPDWDDPLPPPAGVGAPARR